MCVGLIGSEDGADDAVIATSDMLVEESRAILDICEACNNSKSGGATKWEDLLSSVLAPKLKRLNALVGVAGTPTLTGARRLLVGDVAVFATMEIVKDVLPAITDEYSTLAQFCSTVGYCVSNFLFFFPRGVLVHWGCWCMCVWATSFSFLPISVSVSIFLHLPDRAVRSQCSC